MLYVYITLGYSIVIQIGLIVPTATQRQNGFSNLLKPLTSKQLNSGILGGLTRVLHVHMREVDVTVSITMNSTLV
jgi:hypothetical protein